jgi:hypothetical protein
VLRRIREILGGLLIASIGAFLVWFDIQLPVLRLVFTLPLVLFIPGYMLTAALVPPQALGRTERMLLSLGLSLAAAGIGALLLDRTPWGLQARSWILYLSALTLCAGLAAIVRRWKSARGEARGKTSAVSAGPTILQGILLGLAALVTVAAVALASRPAPARGDQGYTLMWMLPAQGSNSGDVRVGLRSMELTPTRYRLEMVDQGQVVQEWPEIELKTGETWETVAALPVKESGGGPVEARLYRLDDQGSVYRRVKYWPGQ